MRGLRSTFACEVLPPCGWYLMEGLLEGADYHLYLRHSWHRVPTTSSLQPRIDRPLNNQPSFHLFFRSWGGRLKCLGYHDSTSRATERGSVSPGSPGSPGSPDALLGQLDTCCRRLQTDSKSGQGNPSSLPRSTATVGRQAAAASRDAAPHETGHDSEHRLGWGRGGAQQLTKAAGWKESWRDGSVPTADDSPTPPVT
jgi:hypothetical protein